MLDICKFISLTNDINCSVDLVQSLFKIKTAGIFDMVSSNCRIGIIGAGTSGVYLADLLIQHGYQVSLFEKGEYPRTDGCGIFVVQSGMKALYQGNPQTTQKILDSGSPAKKFEFRNLKGGFINSETVTYEDSELPGMLVHRKAILEALLESLPPECLHLNAQFESVTQTSESVVAHFSDGSKWEGDLLVGVDGIYSKVREFIVPDIELFYLGDIVWRGLVPEGRDRFCPEGNFIVYARGRGIYSNFFDIGNGFTHWGFFLEAEQHESEVGASRPNNITIPTEELAKLPDEPRAVIESTPPEQITCRFSYDISPLPRMYNGRVVLIGDAAHAKSPTRARGMTSGWEDALSLSHHIVNSNSVAEALENFQTERMPIDHEYQRTSREMSLKIGRSRKRTTAI